MFSLRNFIKDGFLKAIGNKPDYEIKLKSADWFAKGVLLEEDLAEIETAIENRNTEEEYAEILKAEETIEGEV